MAMNSTCSIVEGLNIAISSPSLGYPEKGHGFKQKLQAAIETGFQGIEFWYGDIEVEALKCQEGTFRENAIRIAKEYGALCKQHNIKVCVFEPIMHFEGHTNPMLRAQKLEQAELFIELARAVDTDIVQIATQVDIFNETTGDDEQIVHELQALADMGLQYNPPVRFAFEALAWGMYNDTWQDVWRIVQKVNRSNFGICLDTYHVIARVWGDPTARSCIQPGGDMQLRSSLSDFVKTVPVDKVFYIQISDASRLNPPMSFSHPWYDPNKAWRRIWCENARVFPYEEDKGAFFPTEDVLRILLLEWCWKGWLSFEIYNLSLEDLDPSVPKVHALRAARSWNMLVERLALKKIQQ
ncbi:xylose isomerase-like protein [Dipodascopsis uninucleata]